MTAFAFLHIKSNLQYVIFKTNNYKPNNYVALLLYIVASLPYNLKFITAYTNITTVAMYVNNCISYSTIHPVLCSTSD